MTDDEYNRAAAICVRWNRRSLEVAKARLVKGQSNSEVADAFSMSVQQVSGITSRFKTKLILANATDYMRREAPEKLTKLLASQVSAIRQLLENGYSTEQVAKFLSEENGFAVSLSELESFIEENKL